MAVPAFLRKNLLRIESLKVPENSDPPFHNELVSNATNVHFVLVGGFECANPGEWCSPRYSFTSSVILIVSEMRHLVIGMSTTSITIMTCNNHEQI